MSNIRFGVNYSPSQKWFYSWIEFDRAAVEKDFAAIQSLGVDHIRVHLIWQYFQPNSSYVSEQLLDNLYTLLEVAEQYELDVEVTVLDGWLCGFVFTPEWVKDNNIFTSREIIDAQKLLFQKITDKIGMHKRFMGFDLGNELCVLHHGQNSVTPQEADAWHNEMMDFVNQIAQGKFHVNGVDHKPWFSDFSFSKATLANTGSVTSIHTWILFTGATELYDPMGTGCVHLIEYCIELAKAYSVDPERKIWVEEFGINKGWIEEALMPEFIEQTVEAALSCSNVWGLTWWCSHNIDRAYEGFDKLEYEMRLFDVDNNMKQNGKKFAEIIAKYKENPPKPIQRNKAIVLPNNYFADKMKESKSLESVGWSFGRQFMDYIEMGIRPAIVLESRLQDQEYLAIRGITELLPLR